MWLLPAASSTTDETPETKRGDVLVSRSPVPSWPFPLLPQHCTVPASLTAQLNSMPSDIRRWDFAVAVTAPSPESLRAGLDGDHHEERR